MGSKRDVALEEAVGTVSFSLWKAKEFGLHASEREMSTLGAQRNRSILKSDSRVRDQPQKPP